MKRKLSIDIAKSIGIITVVAAHAGFGIGIYASLFYIPLFVFLSGYVFNEKYSFKELLKRKIKSLYIPFLVHEFIFLIIHNLLYYMHINTEKHEPIDFIKGVVHILFFDNIELMLSPIWFLSVIFLITIIFKILLNIKEKFDLSKYFPIIICFLFMIMGIYFTTNNINICLSFNLKEVLNITLTLLIFFAIGFYIKDRNDISFSNALIALVSVIILIVTVEMGYKVDTRINFYTHNYLMLPISLCGIYITMFISNKLEKTPRFNNFFVYIGKNTLEILILHIIIFKLIGMIQIYCFNYFNINQLRGWIVLYYNKEWQYILLIFGILIPIAVNIIKKKIKEKVLKIK